MVKLYKDRKYILFTRIVLKYFNKIKIDSIDLTLLLHELSFDDDLIEYIAISILENFRELPNSITEILFQLVDSNCGAKKIARFLGQYLENLDKEENKYKLLMKLLQFEDTHEDIILILRQIVNVVTEPSLSSILITISHMKELIFK